MSKPTLKQKLLRQPTKSYSTSPPADGSSNTHQYFSSYKQMALAAGYRYPVPPSASSTALSITPLAGSLLPTARSIPKRTLRRVSSPPGSFEPKRDLHVNQQIAHRELNPNSPTSFTSASHHAPPSGPPYFTDYRLSGSDSDEGNVVTPSQNSPIPSSDGGESEYFTPLSSPATTPDPSFDDNSMFFADHVAPIAVKLMNSGTSLLSLPSLSRGSSKTSEVEEDKLTTYSWPSASDRTDVTSPPTSSDGHTKIRTHSPEPATSSNRSSVVSLPLSTASNNSKGSRHADWAKDVRWLVPPERADWTPPQLTDHAKRRRGIPLRAASVSAIPFTHRDTNLSMFRVISSSLSPSNSSVADTVAGVSGKSSSSYSNTVSRKRKAHRRTPRSLSEKMSFILEEDETGESVASDSGSGHSGSQVTSSPPTRHRSLPPLRRSHLTSSVYSERSYNSYQVSGRTVSLPSPLPASHGASSVYNTYTSLVLPRAAFTPSKHPDRVSSQIDITKSGLAQTTMSTIEIRKGAADRLGSHSGFTTSSRRSLFGSSSMLTPTPEHLLLDQPSPLGFSSHTSPPSKLQSNQVLVQVFMVGLDGLDALIVREKTSRNTGYGFVPGRSFVGRTVEVGFEVRNVYKGDWVFGLLDLNKCGSLAEFITVDRRRVHRAPGAQSELALEQIALLPLCGVPTHRALRTLPSVSSGKKALVLNAHDGAGALLTQALAAQGVVVTAQVPLTPETTEDDQEAKTPSFEERVRLFGAQDVEIGEPLVIIAALRDAEFDYVLDTVGGKRIWEASRWIMRSGGQFTTLLGDDVDSVPYMNSNLKSNLRSIRGAIKRDKGYEWVLPNAELDTEGEDIRDALAAVASMAEAGTFAPWPKWAVPFEQTPEAFLPERGLLRNGGTVVSKILG